MSGARTGFLHICHGFASGGIVSFVRSLLELNSPARPTHHDLLVLESSLGADVPGGCRLHLLSLGANGWRETSAKATKIMKGYDGFLVHALHPVVVPGLLSARGRMLLFQHGMTVDHGGAAKRLFLRQWYSILPALLGAKIVCSTDFAVKKMAAKGIRAGRRRCLVVPFGVAPPDKWEGEDRAKEEGVLRVGCAARLVPQKRVDLLLSSLREYTGSAKIDVEIAGEGPEMGRLQAMAREGIANPRVSVAFAGQVEDMPSFYRGLDLFVMPGREESFGLSVLEAFLHGVPAAVMGDAGGALEFVKDGETGFVLDDGAGLAKLWDRVAAEPDLLERMGRATEKADYSAYDINRTRERLDALLLRGGKNE